VSEAVLTGVPAAPGVAAGAIRRMAAPDPATNAVGPLVPDAELREATAALDQAAAELGRIGAGLRAQGRESEAEIVETGVLMAADPGLRASVETAIRARGAPASEALLDAAREYADAIGAVDDPLLSVRADDVRSLGRRAARIASGVPAPDDSSASADVILVATDLGPADVAELGPEVRALALSEGGVTAHAAIVARSLGLPMVIGLGAEALAASPGAVAVLDGDRGALVLAPDRERLALALEAVSERVRASRRAFANRALPAVTRDGHRVSVFTNAASAAEVVAGLGAGAEGVGLLRTELAFLEATRWPTEEDHLRALGPTVRPLRGLPATVRVLDFGGDKTPPFLAGRPERGIELLLASPEALASQLRAVLHAAAGTKLRVLLPMVRSAADIEAAEGVLREALEAVPGSVRPAFGAMIESAEAVAEVERIAEAVDFLSIGTNDLTHSALGGDRFAPGEAVTHDPVVLRMIARSAVAAAAAGIRIEVCGEAASDPRVAPLLVGMGVDELSVGAARVGAVRAWIRKLDFERCAAMARSVIRARTAIEVEGIVGPAVRRLESLDEPGDAVGESLNRGASVVPLSRKT
jgi:phosphoenolpyruvate-protein kinase (PTS system EI component)